MIRNITKSDINYINILGRELSNNYLYKEKDFRNYLVYEFENNIIGFISFDILTDRAEIIDLIVHINHRNKKIGSELLENAIDYIKEKNCKSVTLEVKSINKEAINLYKKYDFKIISTRKNYYENKTLDAHLMYREM